MGIVQKQINPPLSMEVTANLWRIFPDTFANVVTDGRWSAYPHQRYMMREIAKAIVAGNGRLIINAPPRHAKSDGASKWTPIWYLDNFPQKRVILASYGDQLAANFGREARNEFDGNVRLRTKLREDSTSAQRWNTPQGGGMFSVGVGGPVTGFGGDVIIVDDPHKNWEEANSGTQRQKVKDWFGSTLMSRGEPGATFIVVMQRWHEDDLCGHLLEHSRDSWRVIRLPAIAEAGDPMGRAEGEALCPQRYTVDDLAKIRSGLLLPAWEAMYQQKPSLAGVGRAYHQFKQTHVKHVDMRFDLPLQATFDFNYNPGVVCEVGQYDRHNDAFTCRHEEFGPYWRTADTTDSLVKLIRSYGEEFRWPALEVFGDATSQKGNTLTADSDYDIIERKLREARIPFKLKVPGRNPAVKDRVDTFNEALCDWRGQEHYAVHPDCKRLIRDMKDVRLDEEGLIDKSDGELTHPSDAEGYRVHWQRPIMRRVATESRFAVV